MHKVVQFILYLTLLICKIEAFLFLKLVKIEVINGYEITLTSLIGALAIFLASINIFGGFMVTRRMLEMFKKKAPKNESAGH